MKRRTAVRTLLPAAAAVIALAAPTAAAAAPEATLEGRAILPAETRNAGSSPAPAPFPAQPVGGFSALLDAGDGVFWAMPDNGYGSKTNSPNFLLRVYRVRPEFETAQGGAGDVDVLDFIQLSDPDDLIPFPIVTEGSATRLLTGSDFDPESMRIAPDGTLWFGDEFGPYLLHTDATGRVIDAPIPLPGVKSPQSPDLAAGEQPTLPGSSGFEGMAISEDGRFLYPSLERALSADPDQTRRWIYEFDIEAERYTDTRWAYRAAAPNHVIGDMTALDEHRLLVIERDFLEGEEAEFEKVFLVDLRHEDRDGFLVKREVVDLLDIADPNEISLPARPGDVGLGERFEFPYVTIESVLPLGGNRLALVNDNNFGSTGRNPELPDYNDFIVLEVPGLADVEAPSTTATLSPAQPSGRSGYYTGAVSLALEAGDGGGSGASQIEVSVNGAAFAPYTGALEFDEDGTYTVTFRATDAAGNREGDQTETFRIDRTGPSLLHSGIARNSGYGASEILRLYFTGQDAGSGLDAEGATATLDGEAIRSGELLRLYEFGLGLHEIELSATDEAGNAETEVIRFFVSTSFRDMDRLIDVFAAERRLERRGQRVLERSLASVRRFEARSRYARAARELDRFIELLEDEETVDDPDVRSVLEEHAEAMLERLELELGSSGRQGRTDQLRVEREARL